MFEEVRLKIANAVMPSSAPRKPEQFEEEILSQYNAVEDKGKVEMLLNDLSRYMTEDNLDTAVYDLGDDGGLFFFQDPDAPPLGVMQVDIVRAFIRTTQELVTPAEVVEREVEEVTPENVSQYLSDMIDHFYGFNIADTLVAEYEKILESKDLKAKSIPKNQTTLD